MEAATAPLPGLPGGPEIEAVGEQSNAELWRWQTWVHVGEGAENCEAVHEGDEATEVAAQNDCQNKRHFHAWIRLPNQFQHKDCKDAGNAAKARRKRVLRDPESTAYWSMEGDLEDLKAAGDAGREAVIEELVNRDWWRDFMDAAEDVKEWIDEDEDVPEGEEATRPFEHIEKDQERFRDLLEMPEEERPKDDLEHLQRHVADFTDRHEARLKEIQEPRREAFKSQSTDELLETLRRDRINGAASAEFQEAYNAEMWFLCTARTPQGDRYFKDRETLRNAAPEILTALDEGYKDLTRAAGTSGNS